MATPRGATPAEPFRHYANPGGEKPSKPHTSIGLTIFRTMLSMSSVSAAQAETYYEKDDYYTQGGTEHNGSARWFGRGAAALGLQGAVEPADFKHLLYGKAPNGDCLHARAIDPQRHRAATDYTLSAPKSASIAALIQQDERVVAAHHQAVDTALSVLEARYAQTRVSTPEGRQRVVTGNIVAAVFQHETSREQDPQLHSHCVVMNTTQMPDGSWRSLSNEEIVANQILLGEIYQNELAYGLRAAGYEIEPHPHGQFELRGYSSELLDTFSTRSHQIEAYLRQWQQSLETHDGTPLRASQKKQATLHTRQRKQVIPREVLLSGWEQAIQTQKLALPPCPQASGDFTTDDQQRAAVSAHDAITHAAERESVFRRAKVERFALEHALGQMPFATLEQAIADQNELLLVDLVHDKYTTESALRRERETIDLMQQGQGHCVPILALDAMNQRLAALPTLTQGQQRALTQSLTTQDRISAWQGLPGSGKTFVLQAFRESAELAGFQVRGFAPSAEAANVLGQETGIVTDTVASLIQRRRSPQDVDTAQSRVWVVDEAGLLSAKDAYALLTQATQQNARVILVGDTKQLSAVEAGNPFKSLQAAGIQTAFLDESLRQKTAALKQAVNLLSQGKTTAAVDTLDRSGAIHAITLPEQRLDAIANDYLALNTDQQAETLLLAGTNRERLALTNRIRSGLQTQQRLGADTFTLTSLRNKHLTTAESQYTTHYNLGDIIIPTQHYKCQHLLKHQQYRVVGIDQAQNRLVLEDEAGRSITINPAACQHKSVYAQQVIPLADGDRLRWTRNDRTRNIRNGQTFQITEIDTQGNAALLYNDGRQDSVNLAGLQFADYGLVSTTYSAQGKTANRVMAVMDLTTSQESFYVTVSRAKYQLSLYAADRQELLRLAQRSSAQENASDYLPLFNLVKHHAQTQKANPTSIPAAVVHRDAARDLGGRAGRRATAGDSAPATTDFGFAERERTATTAVSRTGGRSGPGQSPAGASDPDLQTALPELGGGFEGLRNWQQNQHGAVADALVVTGDAIKQFESDCQRRSQNAAAIAATTHNLTLLLERQRQQRQAQLKRQQLEREKYVQQMAWAEQAKAITIDAMQVMYELGMTQQTASDTRLAEGKNYQIRYQQSTQLLSLEAKDGRGELVRMKKSQQDGSWYILSAQQINSHDLQQLHKAYSLLARLRQAHVPKPSQQLDR